MKSLFALLSTLFLTVAAFAQTPVAGFSAHEAYVVNYRQDFDSRQEMDEWTLTSTNRSHTFHLAEYTSFYRLSSFKEIDPESTTSLVINYDPYNQQDETMTSPELLLPDSPGLEFYCGFSGGLLIFGNWTFSLRDVESDQTTQLVNGFMWAQENAYTGPAWIRFFCDLSQWAGRRVQLLINYKGCDGEDVAFDGIKILNRDSSADAQIVISQGESVHFLNTSTGAVASRWEFPGGTPDKSLETNPVVQYLEPGLYDVKLIVANSVRKTDTLVHVNYVKVTSTMPKAIIGLPDEGYSSPWTARFIPTQVPVQFHDRSTGFPTSWLWTFQGTDILTSDLPSPQVTYLTPGVYSLALDVSNSAGTDRDMMTYAIQAGGAQYVWNIEPEEIAQLGQISFGSYGNYAGSNLLGLDAFAEYYHKPTVPVLLDSIAIYFASATTTSPDALLTVRVHQVGPDNNPGEVLATASLPASQIADDPSTYLETMFHLDHPVELSEPFFVSISGIPNHPADNISILSCRREEGQLNTAWHWLADEDEHYQPTGTHTWYASDDSPVSMCICPILDYDFATAADPILSDSKTEVSPYRKQLHQGRLLVTNGRRSFSAEGLQLAP